MTFSVVCECVLLCNALVRLRRKSTYCETILVHVQQFEILLQTKGKFQKILIANFKCFEVHCSIVMVIVVFFCEVVVQRSCCAEMLHTK